METSALYYKLSQISLFTGMGVEELQRIIGKTKIEFQKFSQGETIVRQGDKCGRLLVLISGSAEVTCVSDDASCSVTETVSAPVALQIDAMFGLFQRFARTCKATTAVSSISIGKGELLKLASGSVIFRLNLFNNLSTSLQKMKYDLWRTSPASLSDRIVLFLRHHCSTLSGPKTFHIKMVTMAAELNTSRLEVSRALHDLQTRGLLSMQRGRIEVPSMQRLLTEH